MNSDQNRALFRIFANNFGAPKEEAESNLQPEFIELPCRNKIRSDFKEGDLLLLSVFPKTNSRLHIRGKLFVQAC
jgi:hypothetical protein